MVSQWSRSTRQWAVICLVVGVLSIWLCGTIVVAPATTLAAAASTHSSRSCGQSRDAHVAVTARRSGASIWLNQTVGLAGDSLVIAGAGWPSDAAIIIDAYGYDGTGQLVLGQAALVRATSPPKLPWW
jgi:hypothetical protein